MKDLGQLPEFDVIRLLEAAHHQLRSAATAETDQDAVDAALIVVNSVLEAKHRSSTDNATELSEQLRRAAHALVPIKSDHVQRAMMDMLAAAGIGC